jgi:hypothetical protein
MKTLEKNNFKIYRGAGFLLGFATTIVSAITVFALSNNIAVSISASIPIGFTLGLILEQRFQKGKELISPNMKKILIALLAVGVLLFIAIFFHTKLI